MLTNDEHAHLLKVVLAPGIFVVSGLFCPRLRMCIFCGVAMLDEAGEEMTALPVTS